MCRRVEKNSDRPRNALRSLVRLYQRFFSPYFGDRCRFFPSCSEYCVQAVERFGWIRGGRLALWRILRCHPFSEGWFDPVPETREGH